MKRIAIALALLLLGPLAGWASAGLLLPVTRITSNSPTNIKDQLTVLVDQTNVALNQVRFKISNAGPISSEVTEIYWDDFNGVLSNLMTLPADTSAGVGFQSAKVSPADLPGGDLIGFSADFGVDEGNDDQPMGGVDPGTGINASQMAAFKFDVTTGSYQDVENAILAGALRVGMHVRSIAGGTSDSYVAAVPEPSSFLLMGLIAGLSWFGKRFNVRRRNSGQP